MLGNTAADYFCPSLELLSALLRLPPTVAGVTLLPFGNGAPDVFASIAAFVGAGQGQVGLNSVLGAATFVTSVVVGLVACAVAASGTRVRLHQGSFLRDISFFLLTLMALVAIMAYGKITLVGAVAFISIYVAYGVSVALSEVLRRQAEHWHLLQPLASTGFEGRNLLKDCWLRGGDDAGGYGDDFGYSLLQDEADAEHAATLSNSAAGGGPMLPQWMWTSNVAIYRHSSSLEQRLRVEAAKRAMLHHGVVEAANEAEEGTGGSPASPAVRPLWGWSDAEAEANEKPKWYTLSGLCHYGIALPLEFPRRITIPILDEDRWSKPCTVAALVCAPLLVAVVWDSSDSHLGDDPKSYAIGGAIGAVLAVLGLATLSPDHPPARLQLLWVSAGFSMSILWFYLIANELVAALVALGIILEIDSAVLGLTLLAWGNSIGDLVANLSLACKGSADGVQIAVAGSYAGPMFNTLVGLGLSLVLAAWRSAPAPFRIPRDDSLYWTIGFLVAGLLYALVMLPRAGMRPGRTLGIGLIALYVSFLALRILHVFGIVSLPGLR
eukprot:SM000045S16213  [mRNA]  locus=s45:291255:293970:+ [translate_table: standard]